MPPDEYTQDAWNDVAAEREDPPQNAPEQQSVAAEPEVRESAPAADPLADVNPEVRSRLAKLDELATAMPQLVNELREARGRIGSLQSQWAKAQQQLQSQPSQAQIAAAKTPDKWEALKKDFPEWGDAISEFFDHRAAALGRQTGPSQEEIEQLVTQRAEAATAGLKKQLNEALVTAAHRGWRDTVKTPEFSSWFQAQPAEVQNLAGSTQAEDAIRMLDLYDTAKRAKPVTEVKQERSQRLAAAASAPTRAAGGVTSKKFEDMTPKEQWDFMARESERAAR